MKIGVVNAIRKIFRETTIEPSVLFLNMSVIISNLLYTNLYLQKSCRFNATYEPDLSSPCDDEKAGQQYVTEINSWRLSIGMVLMMVFTIFASSWSEKNLVFRKSLLFIPQFGQVLVTATGCLNTYFWQWPVISGAILETFTHGVTGARFLMGYAAQMYICDITTNTNRITRLGVLAGLHILAIIVGNGAAGFMMRRLGLFVSFCLVCGLAISGTISGLIFIKDPTKSAGTNLPFWKTTGSTMMVSKMLQTVCKERPGRKRTLIWTLLLIDATSLFVLAGESSVFYLFLRYRFGWNEENYSIYILFKLVIMISGTLFNTIILSKYFGIHNAMLGLLSSFVSFMAVMCFSVANKNWQLWSYGILEFLRISTVGIISSLLTECLDGNESGHLMAIRCILGFITPLCFPTYNYIYRNTMDSFPGAFFLVSAVIYLLHIILFGLMYYWFTHSLVAETSPSPSTDTRRD